MAGNGASDQGSTRAADWMAWLHELQGDTDPLGVRALLTRSAMALDEARTPAEAVQRLIEAIEAERAQREAGGERLGALLGQWADTLRVIGPMLPDTTAGDFPSLGPYPRQQAQVRALGERAEAYQAALAQHLDSVTRLAEECTAAFREALAADSDSDEADSPAAAAARLDPETFSARWSAIAEPRYEAWLAEPDTQARIAELINAWSRLVQTFREFADELLEGLGLPSARGLDDLAAELQRQRRRRREETAELRAEIAELRAELRGHDGSASSTP